MTVRKMIIEDYDEVYQLWINTNGMGLNDIDDSREGIAKYLIRNPQTCFVAVKQNRIIGVIISGHDGRRGYIYHTAVAVSERRQGVGTILVNAVLAAMKNEGISKVALVVFSRNENGNKFWQSLGFTERNDLVYRNIAIKEMTRIDT